MSLSTTEVKRLMQSCFPQGTEQYLDWDNSASNVGQFFTAIAGAWKTYGTDILDTLRAEVNPLTCTQNIPVWESALGLANTPIAKFGTTTQRRNAIIAWLRQSGSFSLDDIRAIVQPYFLYANAAQIEILETNRTSMTVAHEYTGTAFGPIAPNGATRSTVTILDDPRVIGPVRIAFLLSATVDQVSFFLVGPDGVASYWPVGYLGEGIVANVTYQLRSNKHVGKRIRGTWTFGVWTGAAATTVHSWALFAEGIGVNYDINRNRIGEGLGAGMFEMAVVADEALLGAGYDLVGAKRALRRWKPAHVRATIVRKVDGSFCAIPDTRTAVPDEAIPCS